MQRRLRLQTDLKTGVLEAVDKGLSASPKNLPSWLFYDERGDELFQAIMKLPEYYPTRCEFEILATQSARIAALCCHDGPLRVIEFGAGDGIKTQLLLSKFVRLKPDLIYSPIDVSEHVLNQLSQRLRSRMPGLKVDARAMRYEDATELFSQDPASKLFIFLGANIGNFTLHEARKFLTELSLAMTAKDAAFIGFDLMKDPRIIARAYDDSAGVTRQFNLNLLHRLNRELGADFNTEHFTHFPTYDPVSGAAKSFLVSTREQSVHIAALSQTFQFQAFETIQTEISQKYSLTMIASLARSAGLRIDKAFSDSKHYFCNVLLRKELI